MGNTITFARADFTKGSDDVEYHVKETVYVPSGIYRSIDALLETINKLDRLSEHLQFKSTSNGISGVRRHRLSGLNHVIRYNAYTRYSTLIAV